MLKPGGGSCSGVVTFAYPVFGVRGHLEFFIVYLEWATEKFRLFSLAFLFIHHVGYNTKLAENFV